MIKGKVHKYGADVNTDVIIPARYMNLFEPDELAEACTRFPSMLQLGKINSPGTLA